MEKVYIVYKITNIINGKIYIGKHETSNIDDGYMGSGRLIVLAIKKYGINSFKKEVLHIYQTYKEAADKEKELVNIDFLNSNISYNLRLGGDGGNTSILKTKEEKKVISEKIYFSKLKNNTLKDSPNTRIKKSDSSKLRIKNKPNSLPNNKNRVHKGMGLENIRAAAKNRSGKFNWINNGCVEMQYPKNKDLPEGFEIGRLLSTFKGKTHTIESKGKIREKILGDICYNNGFINIKIKEGDPIPGGFTKGMIQVHQKFKWINNEQEERKFFFEKEELIPDGWKLGRLYRKRKSSNVV